MLKNVKELYYDKNITVYMGVRGIDNTNCSLTANRTYLTYLAYFSNNTNYNNMKKDLVVTYSGKVVPFRGKKYVVRPEESQRGCKGCVFINTYNCPSSLTQHCLQGFIFKKSV